MAGFVGLKFCLPYRQASKLFQSSVFKNGPFLYAATDDSRRSFGTYSKIAPKINSNNNICIGEMKLTKQQARNLSTSLRHAAGVPGLALNGGSLLGGKHSASNSLALLAPGGANRQSVAYASHGAVFNMGPMMVTLWTSLMAANLIGLVGYCIGPTVHLAVVFPTALALWLSIMASSAVHNIDDFLAHLVPAGAPLALAPLLSVIEAASILIRPITLSIRLVANLSAGHLILGLIGGGVVSGGIATRALSLGVSTFYVGFEVFVAMIQTYIFCNLLSLYCEEHS